MATYDELARQHATNAKAEYEKSLGYLTENLTNQKALDESALKSKYDALLETINRQTTLIEEQYAQDAQAAYVNKMLAGQQLNTALSQLGVDTQGFGVNQRLANENAYGQNLAALQKVRSEGLRDVANQATDAMNNYNVAAQELAANYAAQQSDLAKYMQQLTENHYNNEYSKYLEDLRYQDQLKQQEWENNYNMQRLAEEQRQANMANSQYYAGLTAKQNTASSPISGIDIAKSIKEFSGHKNNPHQPKGIVYKDAAGNTVKSKLTAISGVTVSDYVKDPETVANRGNQKVWKDNAGNKFWWNGSTYVLILD